MRDKYGLKVRGEVEQSTDYLIDLAEWGLKDYGVSPIQSTLLDLSKLQREVNKEIKKIFYVPTRNSPAKNSEYSRTVELTREEYWPRET